MLDDLKSIAKHFMIYGFGRILSNIAGFLLIPLYTNYLAPSEYGTLELLNLTTYVVGMFIAAGIGHAVMRFFFDSEDLFQRKVIISTSMLLIWGISIFSTIWFIVFSSGISNIVFQSGNYAGLFRIIFLSMMFSLTNEIPLSLIRAQQKSVFFTLISIAQLVMSLTLNIVFIVCYRMGIRGIIISGMISQGTVGVFLCLYTFRYSGFHFSYPMMRKVLKYGLPLIPAGLGYFVMNFADRYFLERFTTLAEVGIYALGYKFGMIISSIITEPFLSIYRPKIFELENDARVKDIISLVFTYFIFIELFFGLGVSVLIKDVFEIISTPEYHGAYKVVPLIMFSYILVGGYSLMQIGLLIVKKTKYIAYMVTISAVTCLGLNLLLIPKIGIWGAIFGTLGSYSILFVINFILSNGQYHIKYEYIRILKLLLIAVLIYFISLLVNFNSIIFSLIIKSLLVLLYPLILFLIRFFTEKEINQAKEIFNKTVLAIKS
jgi:O-antigen/teichoic acid export membrane protein